MANKFVQQYDTLGLKPPSKKMDDREKADIIFHAACLKLGIDPTAGPQVYQLPERFQAFPVGAFRLQVIHEAVTNDEKKDWDDRTQEKYGSWFWMNKPGFRLGVVDCGVSGSGADGGPRLCTLEEETQEFLAIECIAYWADFCGGQLPA